MVISFKKGKVACGQIGYSALDFMLQQKGRICLSIPSIWCHIRGFSSLKADLYFNLIIRVSRIEWNTNVEDISTC